MILSQVGCNLIKGVLDGVVVRVGVDIQGDAGAGVSHEVLQTLDVDARPLQIRTEGMPQHMGRDHGKVLPQGPPVFPLEKTHVVLQMHGHLWPAVLIQEQEAAAPVHHHLCLGRRPILQHPLEGHVDHVRHGDGADPTLGFGAGDEIGPVGCSAQLAPHIETAAGKIQIRLGEAVQFADPQPGAQQDHDVVVIAPAAVLLEKLEIQVLLLPGEGRPHKGILGDHVRELEFERVLADHVIVHSHFKGGADHALHRADGALLVPPVVEGDEPGLGVGGLDLPDLLLAEGVLPHTVDDRIIGAIGVFLQGALQIHIPGDKFEYCHLPGGIVDPVRQVPLDLGLLPAQLLQ